jgi:SAM-dependent methyltransferase
MPPSRNTEKIHQQNIVYYNTIADDYDQILDQEVFNAQIRELVATRFRQIVTAGKVMDFGGGTGKDLHWLTGAGYEIFFCEPSVNMRSRAIRLEEEVLHSRRIRFLDDPDTDFIRWKQKPPFPDRLDGLLANFAVINNIREIRLLFESLSLILRSGAPLVALILNRRAAKTFTISWYQKIKEQLFRKPVSFTTRHRGFAQCVFLYSDKEIESASASFFKFERLDPVEGSGFSLLQLTRK